MEPLNDIQEDIQFKISKARSNFKKSPKDRLTVSHVETRLENLEQQWSLFVDTHTKIISKIKKADLHTSSYHKNGVYDDVEESYIEYKSDLKEKLLELKMSKGSCVDSGSSGGDDNSSMRVKLPEIKIPAFSGKYTEWQTFRDLFIGLVHKNKSLDKAQKFYYLKGHLTGEAEQLLRNIQVTAENYTSSWEKLERMYNNKKFLANGILKRLLNQKGLTTESANEIKKIVSTTADCLESIKNLGVDVSSWDIVIIHIISSKLDKDTRKAWELKVFADPTDELPTYVQFTDFLTGRFRGLENLETKFNTEKVQRNTASFHVRENKGLVCVYCSANHKLNFCNKFLKEPNTVRRSIVREKGLCFICLGTNDSAKICKNTVKCYICHSRHRRHHTLLHPSGDSGSTGEGICIADDIAAESSSSGIKRLTTEGAVTNKKVAQVIQSTQPLVSCLSTGNCDETVLLTTAMVKAESKDGTYRLVRALLDQGSQGSFITEAMVQYLGLKKISSKHTITGVGGNKSIVSKYTVTLKLRSRMDPNFEVKVQAYVLTSITSLLPATKVMRVELINLNKEALADPEYHTPNKIDVLLGAEIYSLVIQTGLKKSPGGAVIAQDTVFGWILSGVSKTDGSSKIRSHITVMHVTVESDDMLKKFWELEAEPSGMKKILTEEEIKCEEFFANTTRRQDDGRYVVRLPFRDADPDCKRGETRAIALKRFKNLEFKLGKNIKLKEDYTKVMQEYYSLGHMSRVAKHELNNNDAVYLPHHAVVREDKDTTKVRVVFDASCKGKNGVSLNDNLMIGPTLQAELRHIIMRWRRHPVGIVADITKMYRQVLVDRKDTSFQRILWRDSSEKEMEDYELVTDVTVTFGTASAPYLAVRALQQVAQDEGFYYPTTAKIIKNDFYMDDLMTGAINVEEGYKLYQEISMMLNKAGFQLQKWVSNDVELLNKIKAGNRGKDDELRIKVDNLVKVLGLTWNPRADVFYYSVDLPPLLEPATKRNIISDISRLFDPMGWLSPSIILAKILIQKLWLAGIDWDQEVPNNLLLEWLTYRNSLASLVNVKIPRWIYTTPCSTKIELHGFSDASKMAYAAVVYMRVVESTGNIRVSLVSSKTKVAPIKQVSIPRLELCGAVLLAKLIVEVAEVMEVSTTDLHAWTDSEVVLAWLNSHPSRWKTFVANRVAEILLTLDTHHWSHISSKENPADCASRGVFPSKLGEIDIWFNGPEFLKRPVIDYKKPIATTKLEEIKVYTATVDVSFWNKYSSLSKLVRVVAYCRRFLKLRTRTTTKYTSYLSTREIDEALDVCIKKCQEEEFQTELEELKTKGSLSGKKFKSLNLFLNSTGFIRVGGRLEMSQLEYGRKHPILMPRDAILTDLVIQDAHRKTMHGGPQAMITYLRARYWILGVKNLVKACVKKCIPCVRYSSRTSTQLMGQLPSSRVTPNCKAFLRSGVDYAGPINIRVSKGRGNKSYKGYIALFICMATRAVHLETVSDLTTNGFLAAFKRFVARRGSCAELHSDNGTNFVGAARELISMFNEEKSNFQPELAEYLANNGTQWNFIPPRAANFGGLWEAGVKSTKYHLRRVIGNSTLTFEEMATILAQIEACHNSRPLSYVEDPNETIVLTPGHFLVGEPLVLVPDSNYENSNIHGLRRWQLTQRMLQDFWRRWSQDYLHQFLQRHRWSHRNPEPSVGDVVLVKENDMPPGRWLLGKIEQKHPGPDEITRVVTIFTKGSLIKRPVSKICVLPVTA